MVRRCTALVVLVLAAPLAAAEPSGIEEIRAKVREAVGFDTLQKLPHGITLEGTADYWGIPGTVRVRLHPDGRYLRVIHAKGEHAVGFDGKTRWDRSFSELVWVVELEEADRDRYLYGVLGHRWLADGAGFTLRIDGLESSAATYCLTVKHADARTTARVYLDRATWRVEKLVIPDGKTPRVVEFAGYHKVAGVAFPTRVAMNRDEDGPLFTLDRGGAAEAAEKDPFAPPVVPPGATFDSAVPVRLEVRRSARGLMWAKAAVNGKPAGWFVLDSGNGAATLVNRAVADRLGLPAFGRVVMHGVGRETTRFRQTERFTLGPVTVPGMVVGELPASTVALLAEDAGGEVGGILGCDILSRAVVEIDHKAGTVAVHDTAAYRLPAGAAWEPLHFNRRQPCVRGTFEGRHTGLFDLDTGLEFALMFDAPAVRQLHLLDGRETESSRLLGFGGELPVRKGKGAEFAVLGRSVKPIEAVFADRPGGLDSPYTLGTFGLSALGPGAVVFDYPHRRVAFVPRP